MGVSFKRFDQFFSVIYYPMAFVITSQDAQKKAISGVLLKFFFPFSPFSFFLKKPRDNDDELAYTAIYSSLTLKVTVNIKIF